VCDLSEICDAVWSEKMKMAPSAGEKFQQGCRSIIFLWDSDSGFRKFKTLNSDSNFDPRKPGFRLRLWWILKDDFREILNSLIKGAQLKIGNVKAD